MSISIFMSVKLTLLRDTLSVITTNTRSRADAALWLPCAPSKVLEFTLILDHLGNVGADNSPLHSSIG
jgi:hypothetical protein